MPFLSPSSAAAICGGTYFNDYAMLQTLFIGSNMPAAVSGLLVLFMVCIYPLMLRINRRFAPTRAQMAVVLAAILIACVVPSDGFLRLFSPRPLGHDMLIIGYMLSIHVFYTAWSLLP